MKKRLLPTLLALVLAPAIAHADLTADEYYKEGEKQYLLQAWAEAAEAFKKGAALEPDENKKPAYFYNAAQSYRQAHKCKQSTFYYKLYLDARRAKPLKPEKRKEVEDRLTELATCTKEEDDAEQKRAADERAAAERAAADKAAAEKAARDKQIAEANKKDPDEDDKITKPGEVDGGTPKLVSARLVGGGSLLGAGSLNVPLQSNFALIGGYPKKLGPKLDLEAGAAFTFAPSSYRTGMNPHTAMFTGLLANAGVTYWVAPKIGVRGDLGVGLLVLSGANESPFTDYKPTTGPLGMFQVRAGASVDYAVSPNLLVTVPLAVSFAPAKDGLREDISSFTRFDFMLGVGYRM